MTCYTGWIISNANQALLNCVEGYTQSRRVTQKIIPSTLTSALLNRIATSQERVRSSKMESWEIFGCLDGIVPHASISSTEVDHEISTTGGVPIHTSAQTNQPSVLMAGPRHCFVVC